VDQSIENLTLAIETRIRSLRRNGQLPPVEQITVSRPAVDGSQYCYISREQVQLKSYWKIIDLVSKDPNIISKKDDLEKSCASFGSHSVMVNHATEDLVNELIAHMAIGRKPSNSIFQKFEAIAFHKSFDQVTTYYPYGLSVENTIQFRFDGFSLTIKRMHRKDCEELLAWLKEVPERRALPQYLVKVSHMMPDPYSKIGQNTPLSVLWCLRLFKPNSLDLVVERINAVNLPSWPPFRRVYDLPSFCIIKYRIDNREKHSLRVFISLLQPIAAKVLMSSDPNYQVARLVYERYVSAIEEGPESERSVMYAVMAMEALLLTKDEKEGIKDRLSTRTAMLLALVGKDGKAIYECMKKAYDIRSKYVHGNIPSPREHKQMSSRLATIGGTIGLCDVVRQCICIFLLLEEPKETLVDRLRSAAISISDHQELVRLVQRKCSILTASTV
jgi:hypothetical protein